MIYILIGLALLVGIPLASALATWSLGRIWGRLWRPKT